MKVSHFLSMCQQQCCLCVSVVPLTPPSAGFPTLWTSTWTDLPSRHSSWLLIRQLLSIYTVRYTPVMQPLLKNPSVLYQVHVCDIKQIGSKLLFRLRYKLNKKYINCFTISTFRRVKKNLNSVDSFTLSVSVFFQPFESNSNDYLVSSCKVLSNGRFLLRGKHDDGCLVRFFQEEPESN